MCTSQAFVKSGVRLCMCACLCPQGLYPGVSARLPQWSFTSARIAPHTHLAAEHRPTGLRAALRDLACHPTAPSHTLTLRGLDWSRDLADAVCDVLPSLAHLHISVDTGNEPLTDMQLGALLRLGPAVRSLSVPKLALESEQHSGAVWPWEEVRVREVDLEDLCKLPDPGCGEGSTRRVVASHLRITHTVPEVRRCTHPGVACIASFRRAVGSQTHARFEFQMCVCVLTQTRART